MTFTVEIHSNCSEITVLDTTGADKDVKVLIQDDDKVYIQPQCPESNRVDVVEMDFQMLCSIAESLTCEPGMYAIELNEEDF